jgi:hypothetical protein
MARGRLIKISFGELVRLVGDDSVAATITRVSRATIARYRSLSPADAEYFPPTDVVADLERVAGARPMTELLCRMAGGAFVAEPEAPATPADLLTLCAQLSSEFNDSVAAVCAGLADGTWCSKDGARLGIELDQLLRIVVQMRAVARHTSEGASA